MDPIKFQTAVVTYASGQTHCKRWRGAGHTQCCCVRGLVDISADDAARLMQFFGDLQMGNCSSMVFSKKLRTVFVEFQGGLSYCSNTIANLCGLTDRAKGDAVFSMCKERAIDRQRELGVAIFHGWSSAMIRQAKDGRAKRIVVDWKEIFSVVEAKISPGCLGHLRNAKQLGKYFTCELQLNQMILLEPTYYMKKSFEENNGKKNPVKEFHDLMEQKGYSIGLVNFYSETNLFLSEWYSLSKNRKLGLVNELSAVYPGEKQGNGKRKREDNSTYFELYQGSSLKEVLMSEHGWIRLRNLEDGIAGFDYCLIEALKQVMKQKHIDRDKVFYQVSFLRTEDKTVPQNSHVDFPDNKYIKGKHFVGFFPLTSQGYFLQVWPDKKEYGWVVYIPFGTLVLAPGNMIHGGGFRTSVEGNMRGHLYVYYDSELIEDHSNSWINKPPAPQNEHLEKLKSTFFF